MAYTTATAEQVKKQLVWPVLTQSSESSLSRSYTIWLPLVYTVSRHTRVANGPHFENRTRPEPELASPNPARAGHLFSKPDLGPKAKFIE